MNSKNVGAFISSLRKNKNLTQKALAEELNVSDKAISKWETGKCYPDIEMIEKLSSFFGVSINEILSGKIVESENIIKEADSNITQVMKKTKKTKGAFIIVAVVLSLLVVISGFVAVREYIMHTNIKSELKNLREHQDLSDTQVYFDAETMLRIDIAKAGLKNVIIRQVSKQAQLSANKYGRVYLLADDRYDKGNELSDHYLAIVLSDEIILKDILPKENQANYDGSLFLSDLDGDSDDEIVLHELIGGATSAVYVSRVFDFKNDEIVEIFCSDYSKDKFYDTGFSSKLLEDKKIIIENKFTNYKATFSLEGRSDDYYDILYDKNFRHAGIMVDTFSKIEPVDIDNDGVYELKCYQYTSLLGHLDYIGTSVSVLKLDKTDKTFKVVKAWFEDK